MIIIFYASCTPRAPFHTFTHFILSFPPILKLLIGKIQELRAELNSDKKDKQHVKKKTVLKKIVANMTMGNDMSPLFADVVDCMKISVLEIKKMVYLYLINYSRSKPDMAAKAVDAFVKVNN